MAELQKVACVEDDADIRSIIELALRDVGGLDVTIFPNGPEAVSGMQSVAPQLIILDMMMPEMDGLETLERLRCMHTLDQTPAIFMTAKAQPSEIERFLGAGAIGVITKPFDPMSLANEVRKLWEQAA